MADWLRAAADANKLGERTERPASNWDSTITIFEFHKLGGDLIYDKLWASSTRS